MPKAKLPRNEVIAINQVKRAAADDIAKAYIPLPEACVITGMSEKKLLAFCETHKVRYHKQQNRWVIHRQELTTAFDIDG
ncbi:MAG: hypothetical protein R3C14_11610 [Caldilineaceae bacterium]